jgi:Fur family ferric uptake transcriptional regulator
MEAGIASREPGHTMTTNRIEAECRARGVRLTGQRRLIAEVLTEAKDHPDVFELHRRVRRRDARVSLATVYRTVRRFEHEGLIERHAFRDGRAHYETASSKHHDHLIDLDTGRVIEFRSVEIERLQEEIARRLGYHLVGHRLELYATQASPNARSGAVEAISRASEEAVSDAKADSELESS